MKTTSTDVVGFDLCDNVQHRRNFDDFHSLFQQHLMSDNLYLSLQLISATATTFEATIVVWAKCPGLGGDLVLHRQHSVSVNHLWSHEISVPRR